MTYYSCDVFDILDWLSEKYLSLEDAMEFRRFITEGKQKFQKIEQVMAGGMPDLQAQESMQ